MAGKKDEPLIESEEVRLQEAQYRLVRQYHQRGYDNAFSNLRMYYGKNPELGLGQYDIGAAKRLISAGRHLIQQNFILPMVDAVAGAIVQQKFNASFRPVSGAVTSLTELPNKLIFADKELMNWDHNLLDFVLKGLLHDAAIKIGVSTKYSRLGNISLTSALMNSTFPDPRWRTTISSECEKVWHEAWLDPEEIMALSKKDLPEIVDAARRMKRGGFKYGENQGVTAFNTSMNTWGSLFRVVELYYLKKEKRKATFLIKDGGDVEVPREVEKADIGAWLTKFHPDWRPEEVYEREVEDRISKLCTWCPTLYGKDFLQNEDTEEQTGATPWLFWSASRLDGEPRGFIESVKDSQVYCNYWAGLTTHKIQTEGGGGAQYSNPELFKNFQEYARWRRTRNNPMETFEVKQWVLEKGIDPSRPVTKSDYPAEVYKNVEFLIDKMLPKISKVTPAFLGQAENSGESGYLYRQKKVQSDLQTYTIMYGWKLFWNDLAERYLMQIGHQYSQEMLPREFSVSGTEGPERIVVNEVVDLGDGNYGIKNDMRQLANIRQAVIITDRPDSPTDQAERLVMYSETADRLIKMPGKEASAGVFMGLMIENMPFTNGKDQALLVRIGKLENDLSVTTLEGKLAEAQLMRQDMQTRLKAAKQAEQATAAGMGAPGAPGAPSGEPPIPTQISPGGPKPPAMAAEPPKPLFNAQQSAEGA